MRKNDISKMLFVTMYRWKTKIKRMRKRGKFKEIRTGKSSHNTIAHVCEVKQLGTRRPTVIEIVCKSWLIQSIHLLGRQLFLGKWYNKDLMARYSRQWTSNTLLLKLSL